MEQPWMIFQATKPNNPKAMMNTFYLWNGTWAIQVFDAEGLPISETGWTGAKAEDLSNKEIVEMNTVANNKRKKNFKLTRNGRTYHVIARGTFKEE